MILGGSGKREKQNHGIGSQRRALLACPISQQEAEAPSPTTMSVSVLTTHSTGLRRGRLVLLVELGQESSRVRPRVVWEERRGEVVN